MTIYVNLGGGNIAALEPELFEVDRSFLEDGPTDDGGRPEPVYALCSDCWHVETFYLEVRAVRPDEDMDSEPPRCENCDEPLSARDVYTADALARQLAAVREP